MTSVAQLQEYFLCTKKTNKNNNLFNNSSPRVNIFCHLGERVPWCMCAFSPERNQRCLRSACACFLLKNPLIRENNLINYFRFLCEQSIFVALRSWATDVTWTALSMSLLRFWVWEHFKLCCCLCKVRDLSRFLPKYLNLFFEDVRRSYEFGTTWGWVINETVHFWMN